jgi:GTPase SAR1 family protein
MESKIQKLIVIGFPNSGKTSMKKFLFEHINDEQLLNYPLEPTIGYDITLYQYLDFQINIFDTSGQELASWFDYQNEIFCNSDLILFFFTIFDWMNNFDLFNQYLTKIKLVMKDNNLKTDNILFICHKSDLILPTQGYICEQIKNSIQSNGFKTFFTSIKLRWKSEIFSLFRYLLLRQSKDIEKILCLLSDWINERNIIPIIIIDRYKNIICDFERDESIDGIYTKIIAECESILQNSLDSKIKSGYYIFEDEIQHEIFISIILHHNYKDLGLICLKIKDKSQLLKFLSFLNTFDNE